MSTKRKELASILAGFYQRPVAQVSFELFLSIGVILFFAIFAIRPTILTMADLIKEIKDKRELDKALGQKVAALSSAQTQYLQVKDSLFLLDQAIPQSPSIILSLKTIEKIASDRKLVIRGFALSGVPEEKKVEIKEIAQMKRTDITFMVDVTGDYQSIKEFVDDLSVYRRTFAIDRVVFKVKDDRGRKSLSATLSIKMPYYGN